MYLLDKANNEVYSFSHKEVSIGSLDCILVSRSPLAQDNHPIANLMDCLNISETRSMLASAKARSSIFEYVCDRQYEYAKLRSL